MVVAMAGVVMVVGAEEEITARPFQARLMLYEKSEPYLQTGAVDKKPIPDAKNNSSDSNGQ